MTSLLGAPARFPAGLHDVAPGIVAWLQPNGSWGESNAAAVAGGDGAVLIDTLWDPRLAARMLGEMRIALGEIPITHVINTHGDGDHCWGNQLLAGAEIIASRAAAAQLAAESPAQLDRIRTVAPMLAGIGALPVPVIGTLPLPVLPRVPGRRLGRYIGDMLKPYAFGKVEVTMPTRTFDGMLEVTVGGRELQLVEVGPAHAAGDVIVLVPDAKVAITGDIVFVGVTPIMWAGPLGNWTAALESLLEWGVETVIPGHGPVCGPDELQGLLDYWEWLTDAAGPRLAAGSTPEDAAGTLLDSSDFRSAPWAQWDNPERILVNIAALDCERRGVPMTTGIKARLELFSGMSALAERYGIA